MDVRQKFEVWVEYCLGFHPMPDGGGGYAVEGLRVAWLAYQAAHSSQQEEIERLKSLYEARELEAHQLSEQIIVHRREIERLREALSKAEEKLDGYLESPEQCALASELRAALNPTSASGAKEE
jgi:hypothetical protein